MGENPIIFTRDVLARYKISEKTLWKWRDPEKMPKGFKLPFPAPTIPGVPNRWRLSVVMDWEEASSQK
ncbi:excisionase [Serratia sp. JSRIV002]|uniref:helix-turn-helix transcriptional regulator n=1 Tax=Serratia sp. JSRIV002 TaxID=2831894 RepID=UPI001CC0DC03|nr:excisionase [Serratia sp. JSRIV002]UAN49186.1 excisionase [Serratia sp. JSRIV002]